MKIVADLHTHTNVSDHALSTLEEMIEGAVRASHIAIAITNHGPALKDGAHPWHFGAFRSTPKRIKDIVLISGAEANILPDGSLDMEGAYPSYLDYIVASIHEETFHLKDPKVITKAYMQVLKNPIVNTLGHIGNANFMFDYEYIISQCNEYKKIVEINNSSFRNRLGSYINCKDIAELCKKYKVPIALTSDAHLSYSVGEVSKSIELVQEIDFPEELIVNISRENLDNYFKNYVGIDIFNRKW